MSLRNKVALIGHTGKEVEFSTSKVETEKQV